MGVLVSPYVLKKVSGGVHEGALIKVTGENSWGVADLSPHPSLGDLSWKDEIKNEGLLYKRALQLAQEDAQARKNEISLLTDKKIQNNFLITDFLAADLNRPDYSGQTLKIKGDSRVAELAAVLNKSEQDIKIRIDFNSKLTELEFEKFLSLLSDTVKRKIEYIEDPTVLSPQWKKWNCLVPLASDWQKNSDPQMASYKIVKPAREEIPGDSSNCTFTSSMDHAVGVAHGLRLAQKFSKKVCGFLTLDLYHATEFNKYFVTSGSFLNFSDLALQDSGIGMTEELNKLVWLSVKEVL